MKVESFLHIPLAVPNPRNMFSVEGIDGSGKSTQVREVVNTLNHYGIEAIALRSPSSSEVGTFVRAHLRTLKPWERHTLFMLDYLSQLQQYGDFPGILLWDRYKDSDITSNKDTPPETAAEWVHALPNPRKTFFLEISPEEVLSQRTDSLHDHSADLSWQTMKYQRYLEQARRASDRFVIVDARQQREEITRRIVNEIITHRV